MADHRFFHRLKVRLNNMSDIIFKTENYVFSYRVAGILIHKGKVLLQRTTNDTGYAFSGGHVGSNPYTQNFLEYLNKPA